MQQGGNFILNYLIEDLSNHFVASQLHSFKKL